MKLSLKHVSKIYGSVKAVDDVDLEIADGQFFFLLGPSGCGKTTTLRLIAGFESPSSGDIFFGDRRMTGVHPSKRNIGMVFQNYALWPHMTVYKNIEYGLSLRKIGESERRKRVMEVLSAVRMNGFENRRPNQLSGGQQQRIALARAIVINPDILLFDEPLSNLDAKLRLEMRHELRRIQKELSITTLYVTHDQKEALSMADQVAVMKDGRIVQLAPPRLMYKRPINTFIASFVGETNFIEAAVEHISSEVTQIHSPLGMIRADSSDSMSKGDRVNCSVRPEAIRLGRHADNKDNHFEMKIAARIFLGEIEQYELTHTSGVRLTAIDMNPEISEGKQAGDIIMAGFDKADCILLRN